MHKNVQMKSEFEGTFTDSLTCTSKKRVVDRGGLRSARYFKQVHTVFSTKIVQALNQNSFVNFSKSHGFFVALICFFVLCGSTLKLM